MPTRVYVPATVSELRRLNRDGALGSVPLTAHAVTPDLRRALPGTDEEELEYRALLDAAAAAPAAVVAADVEPGTVRDLVVGDAGPSAVRLTEPVALRQVASFHLPGAVGPSGDPELSWYDATELGVVIDLLA